MTSSDRKKTREAILATAHALIAEQGLAGLTFDAVARRLRISKQAVIYWFPTKQEFMAAISLPVIKAEADAALQAMRSARPGAGAVSAFVRAVSAFHLADLDRFRLVYLAPQSPPAAASLDVSGRFGDELHGFTSLVFDELAQHVRLMRGIAPERARREAVAIDMAVTGMLTMMALARAVNDPLKHGDDDLVDAMCDLLTAGR